MMIYVCYWMAAAVGFLAVIWSWIKCRRDHASEVWTARMSLSSMARNPGLMKMEIKPGIKPEGLLLRTEYYMRPATEAEIEEDFQKRYDEALERLEAAKRHSAIGVPLCNTFWYFVCLGAAEAVRLWLEGHITIS